VASNLYLSLPITPFARAEGHDLHGVAFRVRPDLGHRLFLEQGAVFQKVEKAHNEFESTFECLVVLLGQAAFRV